MADAADNLVELAGKLATSTPSLRESEQYYEASHRLKAIGVSTPPEMRCLTAAIGWPRMYVDSIEERLDIEGFRMAGSSDSLDDCTEWWAANNLDEESGMGHTESMVYGRSYATVSAPGEDDDPDIPIIHVESPLSMFAETDPRTRKVVRAARFYEVDPGDDPAATLFRPGITAPYRLSGGKWIGDGPAIEFDPEIGVPVVPLLNRERLSDRFGKSEIFPELRSFTDAASRAFMNMQAASELMAVPQRLLFGIDPETIAPNGTSAEVLEAYMSRIIAFEDPEGKAMQFSAAELRNFTEILQELSKHVASYTGLPPQYLSFSSDNPASADAIRSSESRLVKKCERKGRMFGGSWEQVMRLATRIMKGSVPDEMRRLETIWRDPATPTFAAKADGVMKLYNGGNGIIPKQRARIDMGYTAEERAEMDEWDKETPQAQLSSLLGTPTGRPSRQAPAEATSDVTELDEAA